MMIELNYIFNLLKPCKANVSKFSRDFSFVLGIIYYFFPITNKKVSEYSNTFALPYFAVQKLDE